MASFTPQLAAFKVPSIDNEPMVRIAMSSSLVEVVLRPPTAELRSRLSRAQETCRGPRADGEGAPLRGTLYRERQGGTLRVPRPASPDL